MKETKIIVFLDSRNTPYWTDIGHPKGKYLKVCETATQRGVRDDLLLGEIYMSMCFHLIKISDFELSSVLELLDLRRICDFKHTHSKHIFTPSNKSFVFSNYTQFNCIWCAVAL